jgi:hypothetical protein
MARAVQDHHGDVLHLFVQCPSHGLDIFLHRGIQADLADSLRSYGDLVHVHIRSMQQAAFRRHGQHGDRSGKALGHDVGAVF